jgi:hypothetical protein
MAVTVEPKYTIEDRLTIIHQLIDESNLPKLLEDVMMVCLEKSRVEGQTNIMYWRRCAYRIAEMLVQQPVD